MRRWLRYALHHTVDLVVALQHVRMPMLIVSFMLLIGTIGYIVVLDVGIVDGLYQAVLTLSTVGYTEVKPFDESARLFTVFLALVGVGTVFYVITLTAATLLEGDVRRRYQWRLRMREIAAMNGHYVICGFGRIGAEVARKLQSRQHDFVIVDNNAEHVASVRSQGMHCIEGNAEDEKILEAAGVVRAQGVISCTDSDASNTYVTLSARALNPEVFIVARAGSPQAERKLSLAGADRVVFPQSLGARRMALSALQPLMADFMDTLSSGRHGESFIAELEVRDESALNGATLADAFAHSPGTTVMGIRRVTGELVLAPRGGVVLHAGDMVIVSAAEESIPGLQ